MIYIKQSHNTTSVRTHNVNICVQQSRPRPIRMFYGRIYVSSVGLQLSAMSTAVVSYFLTEAHAVLFYVRACTLAGRRSECSDLVILSFGVFWRSSNGCMRMDIYSFVLVRSAILAESVSVLLKLLKQIVYNDF